MPRGVLRLRRTAAVASLALAALPLSASPDAAAEARACAGDEVMVAVDPNELGGRTRVACVAGGGTAAQLFQDAGVRLERTTASGMQGYVCRVGDLPEDGRCTQGDSYWSLWWSGAGEDTWAYATLGVDSLELEAGDRVAFAWHQGTASAAPPDVAVSGAGAVDQTDQTERPEQTELPEQNGPDTTEPDTGGAPGWVLAAVAGAVLGAAAVVPLRRRRQR